MVPGYRRLTSAGGRPARIWVYGGVSRAPQMSRSALLLAVLLIALPAGSASIAAQNELAPTVRFVDHQTLTWAPEAGAARYNVYKGILEAGTWSYDHDCLALDLTTTTLLDAFPPLVPGRLAYYLVSKEDAAGNEGSLGAASGGAALPPGAPCTDIDGDALSDGLDNCPTLPNPSQTDFDQDAIGDPCDDDNDNDGLVDTAEATHGTNPFDPDTDDDGLSDGLEVLVLQTDPLKIDTDGDSFADAIDNCRRVFNPNQLDRDLDAVGDVCDNCGLTFNPGQENDDGDALGNVCERKLGRVVLAAGGGASNGGRTSLPVASTGQSAAGAAVSVQGLWLLSGFVAVAP
jgi:thrombospondin type 3 repeat protein